MISNHDNFVFDLGGVVFTIDRDICVGRLDALGLADAARLLDLYCQSGDFLSLEQGAISAGEFFDILRHRCTRSDVTDAELTDALGSFITGLPVRRLAALRRLREMGKKVYALSNTNPIMFHTVIDRLFRQEGLSALDYFDGMALSFQEKVCKPDPEIFDILTRRYGLDGGRTLFLDDSPANCEAAAHLGIDSLLIPENADFIDVLGLDHVN